MELINFHKEFRHFVMQMNANCQDEDSIFEEDDYDIIRNIAAKVTIGMNSATKEQQDIIFGILLVDNFKFLYKSSCDIDINDEILKHLLIYKKTDNFETLKTRLKNEASFRFEVIRNVVELYYFAIEEEYFFLQEGIKKNNLEDKFLKVDKTYVLDRENYKKIDNYDLETIINKHILSSELSLIDDVNTSNMILSTQIYNSLKLLENYNIELFRQNVYTLLMNAYNVVKEEIKEKGNSCLTVNMIYLVFYIENNSIENIINSFQTNSSFFIKTIDKYVNLEPEKQKIKQKNPNN